jgi:hypothetical protein
MLDYINTIFMLFMLFVSLAIETSDMKCTLVEPPRDVLLKHNDDNDEAL